MRYKRKKTSQGLTFHDEEGPQEELAARYFWREDIFDSFPRDLHWQFMFNSFLIYFLFFLSNFISRYSFSLYYYYYFFTFVFLTCGIFLPLLVFSLLPYSLLITALLCLETPLAKYIYIKFLSAWRKDKAVNKPFNEFTLKHVRARKYFA